MHHNLYSSNLCLGDVNNDGRIDSADATPVLEYAGGTLNDLPIRQKDAADVHYDNAIDTADAILILQHAASFDS